MNTSPATQQNDEPNSAPKQSPQAKAKNKNTSECIEEICLQGCVVVREVIEQLEQQQSIASLSHLSAQSQQQVLSELKSVMAVYDEQ